MIWTVLLLFFGLTGTWFAPKHWWGWALSAVDELLWEFYAWHTHDLALALMAPVWFAVVSKNAVQAYRKETL